MALREGSMVLTPKEWFDVPDLGRKALIAEARRRAEAAYSRITIRVKDRFGSRTIMTVDARFWTFDAVKDVDLPVPKWHDLLQAVERRKSARRNAKVLDVPNLLFEDD
jgi:hypothetical protein